MKSNNFTKDKETMDSKPEILISGLLSDKLIQIIRLWESM